MAKTLYRVDLDGEYSNNEEKIAKIVNKIPGLNVYGVFKFNLLFVEVDDSYPNALNSMKAINGIVRIRPKDGEAINVENKEKNK